MKVIKPFSGCPDGHVYPVELQVGDDCPPELEAAGIELGCVGIEDEPAKQGGKSKGAAPENKAQ